MFDTVGSCKRDARASKSLLETPAGWQLALRTRSWSRSLLEGVKKWALTAGMLYLPVVIAGPFLLLYVPKKLFVPGDATATVANILAHESLLRAHIVMGLVTELLFVGAVLALYRLLKERGPDLAAVMALLILVTAPMALQGLANEAATLAFARNHGILSVFGKPERDALTTLLVSTDRHGTPISEMFWGLWLLPLGILVFRSVFLPRFLGVWLFLNGLAYTVLSLTGILLPSYRGSVFTFSTPLLFAEPALVICLLVLGVRGLAPAGQRATAPS